MEKEDAGSCGGTVPVTVAHVERTAADAPVAHTLGPWYVGAQNDALYIITRPPRPSTDDIVDIPDVKVIASVNACNDDANAAFIVRAVNCHDELVAALKAIAENGQIDGYGHRYGGFDWNSPLGKQLRAAIKKAESTP